MARGLLERKESPHAREAQALARACPRAHARWRATFGTFRDFAWPLARRELHLLTVSVATVFVPHITVTLFAAALSGIVAVTSHQLPGLA